jgi:hypothetical protein
METARLYCGKQDVELVMQLDEKTPMKNELRRQRGCFDQFLLFLQDPPPMQLQEKTVPCLFISSCQKA